MPESRVDPSDSEESDQATKSSGDSELAPYGCVSEDVIPEITSHSCTVNKNSTNFLHSPVTVAQMDRDHPRSGFYPIATADSHQKLRAPGAPSGQTAPSPYSCSRTQETNFSVMKTEAQVIQQINPCENKTVSVKEDKYKGNETSLTKYDNCGTGISVQRANSLRSHSGVVDNSAIESRDVATESYYNYRKTAAQQTLGEVSNASEIGLEEDYENDENWVITETDLGEIPVHEKDTDQAAIQQSDNPGTECEYIQCNPVHVEQGVNYILRSETDLKRNRNQFCKQMLTYEDQPKLGFYQDAAAQYVMYEPLESPSQVLQLIQRFQQKIDHNTGENSNTSNQMEEKGLANKESHSDHTKGTVKQNSNVPQPGHDLTASLSPELTTSEMHLECPESHTSAEDTTTVAIECSDHEAIKAIEQLDKSIEEVILYDEEFVKTIHLEDQVECQKKPTPEEAHLQTNGPLCKEDASCQTNLNENGAEHSGHTDGPVHSSNEPTIAHDDVKEVVWHVFPDVTDASVNTDFDTPEEIIPEKKKLIPINFIGSTENNQRNHSKKVLKCMTSKRNGDSRVSNHEGYSVVSLKTAMPHASANYPTHATSAGIRMPLQGTKSVNGHSNENSISESDDGSLANEPVRTGFTKASHRMSTATLDGAVVAQTSDNFTDPSNPFGHHGHFVVVAIDFGTTFSGYAFSFIKDPENIHIMRKWEGGDPGVINQKTLTTVLLTPQRKFHSVGFTARDHYHDLDPEESRRWLYFDKFKMALHHNTNLTKETEIRAANGVAMPAVTIFSHVLRFFKDHTLQELSDQSATRIVNEDIRWVITVPAIWRQPAKQFMRQAAYEAGIASSEYPDQLLIALEPEAASIYCRKLRIHQLVSNVPQQPLFSPQSSTSMEKTTNGKLAIKELAPGTRYMVVDCGGGTVDITVHEIVDRKGNLRELHKPTGGPCGSVMVDAAFEDLLSDIFGADFMEQFKLQRPASFVDLMMAFEARKRNASPFRNNPSNVSLPFSFVDYYKKCKGYTIEAAIKKYGRKDIRWSSQGMLRLEPTAMQQLFTKVIDNIKRHISHVLSATNHTIKYLFLVGGFAESQILQQAIRTTFERKVKVIIPQEVSLAILKGAVLYGREPTVVSVRRSKMTYGVGVLNRFIPEIHPTDKRIVKDGVEWCTDVFDRFVTADQSVGLGDVVLRSYTPARHGQTNIVLHVYCSEKDDVLFITDDSVSRCGTLHLDLSDVQYISVPKRREIQTRMIFGDTELKMTALDVTTGKCVRAQLDFFNH